MLIIVIPEDFRKDQYILKPLFEQLLHSIRGKHTHVEVCQQPRLGGINNAMKPERIQEIVERFDWRRDVVFVLCVDRDGVLKRRQRLNQIENEFNKDGRRFLAENAWEEVETWVLAGLKLPSHWRWGDIRAEVQVKEEYFDKLPDFADGRSDRVRKSLGKKAASRIHAIRQKCPEDFDALATRLEAIVSDR